MTRRSEKAGIIEKKLSNKKLGEYLMSDLRGLFGTGLSGTRRSRKKSGVKSRKSSHSARIHGKKIPRIRSIPQEDVAETKELVKEKLPDLPRKKDKRSPRSPMPKESPVAPEQMLPELDEFLGGEKGRKKRRERIKKNPRKNWKELGLLEKRGLA